MLLSEILSGVSERTQKRRTHARHIKQHRNAMRQQRLKTQKLNDQYDIETFGIQISKELPTPRSASRALNTINDRLNKWNNTAGQLLTPRSGSVRLPPCVLADTSDSDNDIFNSDDEELFLTPKKPNRNNINKDAPHPNHHYSRTNIQPQDKDIIIIPNNNSLNKSRVSITIPKEKTIPEIKTSEIVLPSDIYSEYEQKNKEIPMDIIMKRIRSIDNHKKQMIDMRKSSSKKMKIHLSEISKARLLRMERRKEAFNKEKQKYEEAKKIAEKKQNELILAYEEQQFRMEEQAKKHQFAQQEWSRLKYKVMRERKAARDPNRKVNKRLLVKEAKISQKQHQQRQQRR